MPAPGNKWTPPTPATAGNEELAVTTPVGSFKFSGGQMFPVILLLILSVVTWGLFYQSTVKADERSVVTVKAIERLEKSTDKFEATQRALIYVSTLSQAEKEKLNLLKPKELTEMQR